MKSKFTAQANPFDAEKAAEAAMQQAENATKEVKKEYYRFNARLDMECKEYLNEMAWLNRESITDYLNNLVKEDMARHPDWKKTIDILNSQR